MLSYTLTDLGTLGGLLSSANAINDAGEVVGQALSADSPYNWHAFLWDSKKGMRDLGTLGGSISIARGINDAGQVVGISNNVKGSAIHGFICSDGKMTDLGTFGGLNSDAVGINATGQVVGSAHLPGDYLRALIYSNGVMTNLGTIDGYNSSSGEAINDLGDVSGQVTNRDALDGRAMLYQDGVMTNLVLMSRMVSTDSGGSGSGSSAQPGPPGYYGVQLHT